MYYNNIKCCQRLRISYASITKMLELPAEILTQIFASLSLHDRKPIRLVDRQFKSISDDVTPVVLVVFSTAYPSETSYSKLNRFEGPPEALYRITQVKRFERKFDLFETGLSEEDHDRVDYEIVLESPFPWRKASFDYIQSYIADRLNVRKVKLHFEFLHECSVEGAVIDFDDAYSLPEASEIKEDDKLDFYYRYEEDFPEGRFWPNIKADFLTYMDNSTLFVDEKIRFETIKVQGYDFAAIPSIVKEYPFNLNHPAFKSVRSLYLKPDHFSALDIFGDAEFSILGDRFPQLESIRLDGSYSRDILTEEVNPFKNSKDPPPLFKLSCFPRLKYFEIRNDYNPGVLACCQLLAQTSLEILSLPLDNSFEDLEKQDKNHGCSLVTHLRTLPLLILHFCYNQYLIRFLYYISSDVDEFQDHRKRISDFLNDENSDYDGRKAFLLEVIDAWNKLGVNPRIDFG